MAPVERVDLGTNGQYYRCSYRGNVNNVTSAQWLTPGHKDGYSGLHTKSITSEIKDTLGPAILFSIER